LLLYTAVSQRLPSAVASKLGLYPSCRSHFIIASSLLYLQAQSQFSAPSI
jgi:hypothetical protein